MNPLLEIDQISCHYGTKKAVQAFDMQLNSGEILGFLGPNGAGKSSIFRMLSGNQAPTKGHIRIQGIDLWQQPKKAKAHIGYLSEQPPLLSDLSVEEYLYYCARLHRLSRRQIPSALQRVKQRCGLEAVSNKLIGHLSKGFQQRVGIAQAILHEPALILLDEPIVGLDPVQIREIHSLIRDLGKKQGVLFSTHILADVQKICDRVLILHQGKVILCDDLTGLDRHLHTGSLHITLGNPPNRHLLEEIPGVETVETIAKTEHSFRLWFDTKDAPAERIAITAVEKGWRLQALIPEQHSLEYLFLELVGENAAVDPTIKSNSK